MILVDTGPLVAAAVRNDPHHEACALLLRQRSGELAVPGPAVAETCYMLESRGGPDIEEAFLRLLAAGRLVCLDLGVEDFARMADLVRKYRDLPLGAVEASVIALAERFGIAEVATLDRRHFTVVQPRHIDSLTLASIGRHWRQGVSGRADRAQRPVVS